MNDNMITGLANELEELLKNGKLAEKEKLAAHIIKMLRDDGFSSEQKEQFVAKAKNLVAGKMTADKNNYSDMIKKISSLLNDYSDKDLDEENKKVATDLLNKLSNPDISDEEKDVWFKKGENLLRIMKEKQLLQRASILVAQRKLDLGPEMLVQLIEAMEDVERATPENKRNSIILLEDTLKQCYTVLEGSPPGK